MPGRNEVTSSISVWFLQTPLHLATYLDLPPVVRRLVERGASLALQDHDGNTPLHVACEQGRGECASEMTRDIPPSQLILVLEAQNWRGECLLGCVCHCVEVHYGKCMRKGYCQEVVASA